MFDEARFAFFRGREANRDLSPGRVTQILHNGNRILERYFGSRFGRVEPGFAADLVMLDEDTPTPLTEENVSGHFIFGYGSRSVNTVVARGKVVYEDGRFPFDTEPIYRDAREQAARLWKALDAVDV
jgi:cytosine/adenosine deaminase-related metal-dependent hydrolase